MTGRAAPRPAFALIAPLAWGACCLGLLCVVLMGRPDHAAPSVTVLAVPMQAQPADAAPGWLATFKQGAKGGKPAPDVSAVFPVASFALQSGQSLHPSVPAAGFTVVYSARMKFTAPGVYRFGGEVEGGTLSISLFGPAIPAPAGKKIDSTARLPGTPVRPVFTDWLTLRPGELNLRYEFARSGDAPARLRAAWEEQARAPAGFVAEPIPHSAVLLPTGSAAAAAAAESAFHGRVLLGELGCAHCHAPITSEAILERRAPYISGIGARASPQWLTEWVRDPQKVKPGCGMPDVFGDSKQDRDDADAIVQFLSSLDGPFQPGSVATEPAVVDAGRRAFLQVGCVACHGDLSPGSAPAVPFGNLAGKWNPGALSKFLQDPLASHPAGRMPSLGLSAGEADLIATFLVASWGPSKPLAFFPDPARIDVGRNAFAARGCADCHRSASQDGPDHVVSTKQSRPLPTLRPGKGCLDPADTATPRYTLSNADRADLGAALAQAKSWSGAPCPTDAASLSMNALGCINCHEWNDRGGVDKAVAKHFETTVETDLGDEGSMPPRLHGVGGKLTSGWLRQVFLEGGRARPYMGARMPQFGKAQVGLMAERLASYDGVWPDKDTQEPNVTPESAEAGRTLSGIKGLNCISCHAFSDAPLAGTPGPDIVAFAERLRYDWWRRYIMAPERFKPGTRMPSFFAKGIGDHSQILGGDPARQSDALWAYFTLGEFAPPPDGLPVTGGLEVRAIDKPVILRAFLKNAGSRGIAVGFPAGTHFAFDAEACRLAEVWHGKFLDASGAWAGRGGMTLKGQGPGVWTPPAGPALVVGPRPEAWPTDTGREAGYRFKGYQLDPNGSPVFNYTIDAPGGPVTVSERYRAPAAPGGQAQRQFSIVGGSDLWINAGTATPSAESSDLAEAVVAPTGETWLHIRRPDSASVGEPLTITLDIGP